MIILGKIAVTLVIVTVTSFLGCCATQGEDREQTKAFRVFACGLLVGLGGLILCLIAYVWVR